MFRVKVRTRCERRLIDEMQRMRTWLDHQACQSTHFSYASSPGGIVFLVHFITEAEATAFASEFAGEVSGAVLAEEA